MNKFVFQIVLLLNFNLGAQDAFGATQSQKNNFSKTQIIEDSLLVEPIYFSENFKSKYTDKAFIYEYKTPEKNAWDRFMEWLSEVLKSIFNLNDGNSALDSAELFKKIIAGLIVVFVIYLIVKAILNNEGQWIFGNDNRTKKFEYSEIEKNLHLVDFEKLIQKSIENDEKRITIRYYYLWMLKKMSDKKIIVWDLEKTNSDYIYEIKDSKIKENFAYLSYLYNNIWYGNYDLTNDNFHKAITAFEKSIPTTGNG